MFRFKLVGALFAALAAFAIPAGSAFASTAGFVTPVDGATISQNVTFTVDTTGDAGAAGVDFYLDDGNGGHTFLGSGADGGSGTYSKQVDVGGWTDGPITIDANVVDVNGQTLEPLTENLTVANDVTGPMVTGTTPAADADVSGTFTLSVAANDPSGIAVSEYSLDNGTTWQQLTADGHGNYAASIDTVAQNVPNGDLYVQLHFEDAGGGYQTDDMLHLNVENPLAPTITPNTLVADKAQFRTDETQLEVGDKVEGYNMQADGFPAPTISYVWHFCPAGGGACYDEAADSTGLLTIQPSDEGATLTLIATATNPSGSDSTTVGFGVIGPAYVAPAPTPSPAPVDPTPAPPVDPTPAPPIDPAPAPPVDPAPAPPVAAPPVAAPPAATPPAVALPTHQPGARKPKPAKKAPRTSRPGPAKAPASSTPATPKSKPVASKPSTSRPAKKAPKRSHPGNAGKPARSAPTTPRSTPTASKPKTSKPAKKAPKTGHSGIAKKKK